MKIQLDTKNKTISIDENVNLGDFLELLEELLPNGKWADFTLIAQTVINWNSNPIIIDRYPQPAQPYWQPWITYGSDGTGEIQGDLPQMSNYNISEGVYNLEVSK